MKAICKAKILNKEDVAVFANISLGIFLISILSLFLEMLLIRWIGTEVRIFAYLQNTVLIVCFLGFGLGLFTCEEPIVLRSTLLPLLILVFFLSFPYTHKLLESISQSLSVMDDMVIWYKGSANSTGKAILLISYGLFATLLIMIFVLDIFVPLGRILGRLMNQHHHPIWAYSVNVAGSLIGTWVFVLMSTFYQPPVVWLALCSLMFLPFVNRNIKNWRFNILLLVAIVAVPAFSGIKTNSLETIWSPYQKLVLTEVGPLLSKLELPSNTSHNYKITVNNIGYQSMLDLRSQQDLQRKMANGESIKFSQYDIPFMLYPNPKSCLLVGAGSGNDAAGAVRAGVENVVAVEIDPAIIKLGKRYHPEKPYSNTNIKIVTDDARSYFSSTTNKFDIIVFGLLDSHTTTAMTNARLDHYVYTRESIEKAKSLLSAHGILVLSFEASRNFIADRIARTIKEVFHEKPMVFRIPFGQLGWGGVLFVTGDMLTVKNQLQKNHFLASYIKELQNTDLLRLNYTTEVATDDWPYIYLETRNIPTLYYLLAILLMLLLIRSYRAWHVRGIISRWGREHWHFFFLGAAFLLLEVQNISKASVALGNTWQVNAIIVSGVLLMILLANYIVTKFSRIKLFWIYGLLILTCVVLYMVKLSSFSALPYLLKAGVIGGLTTLPMLFSGIIFIRSFAIITGKGEALGANLVGALIGGLLQSVTFIIGIKALLLIVLFLYLLSLLTINKKLLRTS